MHGDVTGGGHLFPGAPGKTPFPQNWGPEKIMHYVSDIVTDPKCNWIQQTGIAGEKWTQKGNPVRFFTVGEREGVQIRTIIEPWGKGIITAYPN